MKTQYCKIWNCDGRNVTDKVSNQTRLIFPPNLTNASALPGKTKECESCIYSLNCSMTPLPDFNQKSLFDFFSLIDS